MKYKYKIQIINKFLPSYDTEICVEEGDEDSRDDGSDSNDEGLESESELWRGSEEQPVGQGGFVQQPAMQETVPGCQRER